MEPPVKGEHPISPRKTKKASTARKVDIRSAETQLIGRKLAAMALAWVKQDGQLGVRQKEKIRRALSAAAEALNWAVIHDDPYETAAKDVVKLTNAGAKALAKDLADELVSKKAEMTQLKKAAAALVKLSEKGDFTDPIEFTYTRTAREAHGLGTKTEVLTLLDADEALNGAAVIEKKTPSWEKLRDLMLEALKKEQKLIAVTKDRVPEFVDSTKGTVKEVFATLA